MSIMQYKKKIIFTDLDESLLKNNKEYLNLPILFTALNIIKINFQAITIMLLFINRR